MASLTQWIWVWASSGRWWRTGKPGVLQTMALQRVRHDWVTEQYTNILPMTETFDVLFISLNPHNKITKVNIYDPTFINEETGSGRLWQISSVAHSTTFHFSFSFLIEPWYLPLKVSCLLYVAGTSGVPSLTQQERRGNWFTSANLNNPLSPCCHGLV